MRRPAGKTNVVAEPARDVSVHAIRVFRSKAQRNEHHKSFFFEFSCGKSRGYGKSFASGTHFS